MTVWLSWGGGVRGAGGGLTVYFHPHTNGPFFQRLVSKYFHRSWPPHSETKSLQIPFFQWMNSSWIPRAKCALSLHSTGGCYPDWHVHMLSRLHLLWYLKWALPFAETLSGRQRTPDKLVCQFYLCCQRSDVGGWRGLATVFSHLRLCVNGLCFPVLWSPTKSIRATWHFSLHSTANASRVDVGQEHTCGSGPCMNWRKQDIQLAHIQFNNMS